MLPGELPTLTGERVLLRSFTDADAELIRSVAQDPLIPLITTVPTSGNRADAVAFIERQLGRIGEGAGYSFAVADRRTGSAVGQIGLWLHDLRHGRASVGYWVAAEHRRRGYASDALATLVDWAVTLPGIDRLDLSVEPGNEGSRRTAQACGFQREGLLRSWQRVGDERKDMEMYALIPPPR